MRWIFPLIPLLFFTNCDKQMQADLIVKNATIYTVDSEFSMAEAMAIIDGNITALGSNKMIMNDFDASHIIDAEGRAIYPGFIDPHCHFLAYGENIYWANLVGTASLDEVVERIFAHAKNHSSSWIIGRGWDQNDWEETNFPTKHKLDSLFPDKPVVLYRVDGHAILVNQKALDISNVTVQSSIEGGSLLIQNGELTGVLIDNAQELVERYIPDFSEEEKTKALDSAQSDCFGVGLTTVSDAGLHLEEVLLIDRQIKEDKLQMRIYAMLNPSVENMEYVASGGYSDNRHLFIKAFKLYSDGALGSRGAMLIEPYSDDPENKGFNVLIPEFDSIAKLCLKHNFQLNIHCIGDGAVRMILDKYENYLEPGNDRRWRIEHAQVVNPDDLPRFGKLGVIPSIQATHATSDMYWAEKRLGKRVTYAYAYNDLVESAGLVAGGSDFPVESINPLFGFYAAVARKDQKGWPEGGFQIENALSREEALKSMTIWAAYSNYMDHINGSLEIGKVADFVILDRDIMNVDHAEIFKAKVINTYVDGKMVYPR